MGLKAFEMFIISTIFRLVTVSCIVLSVGLSIAAVLELQLQQQENFKQHMQTSAAPSGSAEWYAAQTTPDGSQQKLYDQSLVDSFCYMDEIFHIPAAWRYGVDANWTYLDPMITTPPGAYVAPGASLFAWATDFGGLRKPYQYLIVWYVGAVKPALLDGMLTVVTWATSVYEIPESIHTKVVSTLESLQEENQRVGEAIAVVTAHQLNNAGTDLTTIASLCRGEKKDQCPTKHMAPTQALSSANFAEGVTLMRLSSVLLHEFNLILCLGIGAALKPESSLGNIIFAASIFLLPVLNFFTVLVYTDVASAMAIFLVIRLGTVGQNSEEPLFSFKATMRWMLVALAGAFGIFIRQTNIVWLFFVAARHVLGASIVGAYKAVNDKKKTRRFSGFKCLTLLIGWAIQLLPVIAVAVGFIAFIFLFNNGNIVLGDASHHQPVMHWAQLAHFFVFAVFTAPMSSVLETLVWILGFDAPRSGGNRFGKMFVRLLLVFVLFCGFAYLLERHVFAHAYILADNRHFTFYYQRKLMAPKLVRLVVLPLVAAIGAIQWGRLLLSGSKLVGGFTAISETAAKQPNGRNAKMAIDALLFLVCLAIGTVPQELLEFRYFAPPLVVLKMLVHEHTPTDRVGDVLRRRFGGVLDVCWLFAIHIVTVLLFLHKPFTAPDGTLGRFMW